MGFRDKVKGMQEQAQEAAAGSAPPASPMSQAMGGDMAEMAAYAQMANKINQVGVEAPGVIHTIRPTGQTDMSGGQKVEFDVSVKPADGEPYQTTIKQTMLPAQLEDLSDGKAITVKYDPDSPQMALIFGW